MIYRIGTMNLGETYGLLLLNNGNFLLEPSDKEDEVKEDEIGWILWSRNNPDNWIHEEDKKRIELFEKPEEFIL